MKTVNEEFDDRFDVDNIIDNFTGDEFISPRKIKQFYNNKISEIVKEMIGEKKEVEYDGKPTPRDIVRTGYNKKRAEIIEIVEKYNIKI